MSFLPRRRQPCLRNQDPRLILNSVFLSGILIAEPEEDRGRNGDQVTLVLVAFPAPDAGSAQGRSETSCDEIEVPADVMAKHGRKLRAGNAIFITGQLTGGGGVVATGVHSGPPPAGC